MTKYRILLVDDQHEVRRVLKAGIESLGPDFQVLDMPSGEEAMLVLFTQPFDLLITDIRLPGITGLELKERVQRRNPDLKIILITGLTDATIRQQVRDAGASAYFIKPIALAEFLETVEQILGVGKNFLPSEPEPAGPKLSERLAAVRHDLGAVAVLLLDEQGRTIAEAGSLPDLTDGSPLLTSLMSALSAGRKISYGLDSRVPDGVLFWRGQRQNLALVYVGDRFAMLVAAPPQVDVLKKCAEIVFPAMKDLLSILSRMGALTDPVDTIVPFRSLQPVMSPSDLAEPLAGEPPVSVVAEAERQDEPLAEVTVEELKEFEALLGKATQQARSASDLDEFWEAASQSTDPNDTGNANSISYDQARKLGLAPGEEPD